MQKRERAPCVATAAGGPQQARASHETQRMLRWVTRVASAPWVRSLGFRAKRNKRCGFGEVRFASGVTRPGAILVTISWHHGTFSSPRVSASHRARVGAVAGSRDYLWRLLEVRRMQPEFDSGTRIQPDAEKVRGVLGRRCSYLTTNLMDCDETWTQVELRCRASDWCEHRQPKYALRRVRSRRVTYASVLHP